MTDSYQRKDHAEIQKAEDQPDHETEANLHTSYGEERAVLECIRNGDIEELKKTYFLQPPIRYGNMSSDPLKKLFYGSIANTTLVTRFAIEGGLGEEEAFSLSDCYIRRMELCNDISSLQQENIDMALDFTQRVHEIRKNQNYSIPVRQCMDYIHAHRREKITLSALSKHAKLSEKYLSALFAKETGTTISGYIRKVKIECAENLLRFSSSSISSIADYLSYSSQSRFAEIFRQETGVTPHEYRRHFLDQKEHSEAETH